MNDSSVFGQTYHLSSKKTQDCSWYIIDLMYGKQVYFCNNCGSKKYTELPNVMGRAWRCCSSKCLNDILLKESRSICGDSSEDPDVAFRRMVTDAEEALRKCREGEIQPPIVVQDGARGYTTPRGDTK